MTKLKSQLLTLCDFAMTSSEGKLSIIGMFDRMFIRNLPGKFSRFFIVGILTGEPDSQHKITLNIIAPSGKKIMDDKTVTLKLGTNGKTNTLTDVSNFPLPEGGEYKVQITTDNQIIAESIFNVTKVTRPSGNKASDFPN